MLSPLKVPESDSVALLQRVEHRHSNAEVQQQAASGHDGGDEGGGHQGRVQTNFLGQQG